MASLSLQQSRRTLLASRELLAEFTDEDRFLGSLKPAIVKNNVNSLNKLGAYLALFWTKAAVVINCVILDNKMTIPEQLRTAVLARLQHARIQTGQKDVISASTFFWWPFLIVELCGKCTLFGKSIKTTGVLKSTNPLPKLIMPIHEIQLVLADPVLDCFLWSESLNYEIKM